MARTKREDVKVRDAVAACMEFWDEADRRDRDPVKLRRLAQLVADKAGDLARVLAVPYADA